MSGFVKLGDLTHIRTGKLDANASSENGQYPFFTCSKEPLRIASYSYDCECVLVAGNGDLNVKYYDGKFDAYQRTYIIESADKRKLLVKYLYFFLDIYVEVLRTQSIGGVIKYIKLSNLTDALIPLPSIKRQAEIIECLEKCNTLIDKRQREIALIEQTVKSRFIEMFVETDVVSEWPYHTIADVSNDMRTGPFGSALHHDEFVDSGVFVLGIDNAVENKFSYSRMRYITEEKYQQLKRYTVHPGDVIITIMGTVGRSAVIPVDMPKAINTKHLACITPKAETIDAQFLSCAFQVHPDIRMQLQKQCKGAIMDGLNLTIIKGLSFHIPPISLQKQFVEFYEQTDKSKYYSSLSFRYCQAAANTYRQEWMTCRTSDF